MAEDKKWTHERKKLLIATRLRHEPDFTGKEKKRNTIWETILREIKDIDSSFPFSRDEITRCFLKIIGTYKRIKKRNNTSGGAATNWEYFDDIDEVFGSRSSIDVPNEMLEYSLQDVTNILLDNPTTESRDEAENTPTTSTKRKRNEVIEFLQKDSEKEEEIINKVLKIESEKLEVEKEKVKELKELRAIFQKIVEKNSETPTNI